MRTLRTSAPKEWVLRQPGGQELALRLEPGETITVGRDLTCELPILDAGVSRHHATFVLEGEDLWLEDLHSQNGTFVNTERVYHTRVHSGDIITLGRIPLTITARAAREEELDPLRRLSPESLTCLLRVSRELAAERGRAMIFQRLMELAMNALKAERGVVFLWEEARDHFHPVAACPQDLFQDATRLVNGSLASSLVRSKKARVISEPISSGVTSAIATPLFAGDRTLGVLYLDRGLGQRGYQPADADLLFALAWVISPAMSTFSQLSDSRDWNERLESTVSDRTREIARLRARGTETDGRDDTGELLGELEHCLTSATAGIESAANQPPDVLLKRAASILHAARLTVEAARRLEERHPERYEEVSVERLVAELAGLDRDRRSYEILEGGTHSVFCDPGELLLTLRLLSESVLARAAPQNGLVGISAAPARAPGFLGIRVVGTSTDSTSHGEHPVARLAERIAERIVTERLHGELEVSPDGAWAEVRLPLPAASLGETMVLHQN